MDDLDKLFKYFIDNINNEDIILNKSIKNGYRRYYIYLNIKNDLDNINLFKYYDTKSIGLTIDLKNKYIELKTSNKTFIIENEDLVNKYSDILESLYTFNLNDKISNSINSFFNENISKHSRNWKIEKLI